MWLQYNTQPCLTQVMLLIKSKNYGEIMQLLRLGTPAATKGNGDDGRVRVSILLDAPPDSTFPPTMLTAEITEASAGRMQLSKGKSVYATFKATEARAYT